MGIAARKTSYNKFFKEKAVFTNVGAYMEWIQEGLDEVRSEDNGAEDLYEISFHVIFFRILSSYLLNIFI